jgi:hypothetical protein
VQAADETRVEDPLHVGGEDHGDRGPLHLLKQVSRRQVGVPVVAVVHLAALAEQRVGLVEQQDHPAEGRRVEDGLQVLLRLADPLAQHGGEVDPVQVEA